MERLIFEITETERVKDKAHLRSIVEEYRRQGFKVALDDFGSGYSELNMLADLQIDYLKLDIDLVKKVHKRPSALLIVKSIVALTKALGMEMLAEGVETLEEFETLRDCGVRLMQGYFFAKPAFETLPPVTWPEKSSTQGVESSASQVDSRAA
ncbi:EAL domain protein [Granulicella sibirica]|uniref:EAL domain protein n=1 Tax=Granulicella sibirica TaxID=2479048 RepID=A0A4Q0T5K4_9BACT|nr:EAL domain protein [Granulicella sibirica]